MSNGGKEPAHIGIPREKIYEAMKSFSACKLRISRTNDKGQIQQLYGGVPAPLELLLEIDRFLEPLCGGGRFRVEAENPNGIEPPYVVAPFVVAIEAPPRPRVLLAEPQYTGDGIPLVPQAAPPQMMPGMMPGMPMPPGFAPQPAPQQPQWGPTVPQLAPTPGSGWANGLHPETANAYIQAANQMYAPGGSPFPNPFLVPPASRAKEQSVNNPVYDNFVAQMRGQFEKANAKAEAAQDKLNDLQQRMREDHDKLTREHERKVDEMRRQYDETRRALEDGHRRDIQALEKQHQAEEKAWDRERQDLRDRALRAEMAATAAPKSNGLTDIATALGPVALAMINNSSQRSIAESQNQIEMFKLQLSLQPKEMNIEKLATIVMPVVVPLMTQFMSNRSPDAIAALLEASQNSQMQALGVTMQMIEAMSPEEKPWWAQALTGFLQQMGGVSDKLFEKFTEQQQRQPQPKRLPQNTQRQQVQQQQVQAAPQRVVDADPVAADVDAKIMPFVPASFQTLEWRNIIVALRKQVPQETMATMLADHLGLLIEQKMLPPELSRFAEEPVEGLDSLIRPLMGPLGLSEEYVVPALNLVLEKLSAKKLIDWKIGEEEDDETLEEAMEDAGVENEGLEHEEAMA